MKKITVQLPLDMYNRILSAPDFENVAKFIKEAIEEKLNKNDNV